MLKKICIALLSLTFLNSCLPEKITIKGKGNVKLNEVWFEDLRGWEGQNQRLALLSFLNSCDKFAKMPQNRLIGKQLGNITASDFRDVCEIGNVVKGLSDAQIKNFFENWFKPFLISDRKNNSRGLFTGYYEASLNGSKIKTKKYRFPIYKKPRDLTSEPYLSREEIENGALKNKNLEILYVDDEVELFFMHIQGSGRIKLPNGSVVRIAFAAKNNQPFSPISTYLLDNNLLKPNEISAQNVKKWLKENPEEAKKAMNFNASYIFFEVSRDQFVKGAQGVELTAMRSMAVDSDILPYGIPLWLETSLNGKAINKLMIAQDTGSAIKGVVRGDLFFGYGQEAEDSASSMANFGQYYALLPINIVEKLNKKGRW
jgi:membrane-bound lytic murein transglycosylase A